MMTGNSMATGGMDFRFSENIKDETTIILASASPRRREILERLGIPFVVSPADIDEAVADEKPDEAVRRLAFEKVMASQNAGYSGEYRWHLAADTMVTIDSMMLGKPADAKEAEDFLVALSGREHTVLTALSLLDRKSGKTVTSAEKALVRFARLTQEEISWYIGTGEWAGAAGGYRIQEKGECLVERIEGSFSNVMGLPIRLFFSILLAAGYPVYNLPSAKQGR